MVEAGIRPGSLNTAAWASSLGRTLAAVPGPDSAASAGTRHLIRTQDAHLTATTHDIQELLPPAL